jgi:hypothetical protein
LALSIYGEAGVRYYVVTSEDGHAYISAETVRRDDDDGADRRTSLASAMAGANARILTEDELSSTAEGRALLEAWNGNDDRVFDDETREIAAHWERKLRSV